MNGITWLDWITAFSERVKAEGREVVLIVDNVSSYKGNLEFEYVKVIFLPSNAIFCTQPMDAGIIRSFKASYRRYFLQYIIESYEENKNRKVVLDLVIRWISSGWINVTKITIRKS